MSKKFRYQFKLIILFYLLPLFVLGQKTDYTKWNLKGKIKSIKELSYTAVEKDGKVQKDTLEFYYMNEFNSFGNKIKDTKYAFNGKVEKNYVYVFNKNHQRAIKS